MERFILSLILATLPFSSLFAADPTPSEPGQVPVLEPVFSLDPVEAPMECGGLACVDGAVFDGRRLAAKTWNYAEVQIYARRKDGTWEHEATLRNPNPPHTVTQPPEILDRAFGRMLVLNGRDLLVSSYWFDETQQRPSYTQTHVFRLIDGEWRHVQSIDGSGSVGAVEGNTVLLASTSVVRVVRRQHGYYYHESEFTLPSPSGGDITLSLRGGTAVFGRTNVAFPDTRGAVHIYRRFGRDWYLQRTIEPRDDDPFAHTFGWSVATDGSTVAIGAPGGFGGDAGGRVDLFERYGWRWRKTLSMSDPYPVADSEQEFRSFGTAVDVVGGRLAIGASNGYEFWDRLQMHLYERRKHRWTLIANTRTAPKRLTIAGAFVMGDGEPLRYGTFPRVYQWPTRSQRGMDDDNATASAPDARTDE